MTDTPPLAGQVVVFAGTLARSSRREATALVERQLGRVVAAVTRETTMLVLGRDVEAEAADERRVAEARRLNERYPGRVRIVSEDDFYGLAGVDVETADPAATLYGSRAIRSRYPALRDDHLRYLERWGLIRPVRKARNEAFYGFADLAVIRQASAELARGLSFRAVLRALVAERAGQLAFDFQPPKGDTQPAKVVTLTPRVRRGTPGVVAGPGAGTGTGLGTGVAAGTGAGVASATSGSASAPSPGFVGLDPTGRAAHADEAFEMAARYFADGSALDTGDDDQQHAAMLAYRRALALDPYMVAALVNLANLHYAHDAIAEAEALYEKALSLEPTCFEARFNLGNVFHDTGRFEDASRCYIQALSLDPGYADAHFYLAVTLEKLGRSPEARPHWMAYQRLAPEGEWVELAREFSD
jgi:tetratricopeptide (TPR) repeat protein